MASICCLLAWRSLALLEHRNIEADDQWMPLSPLEQDVIIPIILPHERLKVFGLDVTPLHPRNPRVPAKRNVGALCEPMWVACECVGNAWALRAFHVAFRAHRVCRLNAV